MQVKTGTYTGNGAAGHAITGVGFQADFLLIKGGSNIAQGTTATMGADATKPFTGSTAPTAGRITSVDSDGFTLANQATVNANGTVYYYLAIKADATADFAIGSYVGNGSASGPAVSGLGFQPELVLIMPNPATAPTYGSGARVLTNARQPFNAAESSNSIQFDSGGFTIVTSAGALNTSGSTYYYMCLKTSSVSKIMQYTGNGTDNTNITGVGFNPTWALVNLVGNATAVLHEANDATDNSQRIDGTASAADEIQSLITDGIQVGTSANVNTNTSKYLLWAMATGTSSSPITVTPNVASLTLAVFAPVLSETTTPNVAALSFTSYAPAALVGTSVSPDVASLILTSFAPTVTATNNVITPGAASLTLTTFAPASTISAIMPAHDHVIHGYIADRPTITYDGSGLMNRIIPFGVDGDGTDLTLEHADPPELPYAILNDGDTWYLQDSASITKYGLFEQRVYRTDIKNPYQKKATGALVLGANPTAGDTITINGFTYTYTATPSTTGDIALGATLPETKKSTYLAMVGMDGINAPAADVDVAVPEPAGYIAPPTVDAEGNWTSLPPWAGMTFPTAIPLTATADGPPGEVPTISNFTSPANYFVDDTLVAGQYAKETANVLYAVAVNELIKRRSEILSLRVQVANGADIWALPGDRMQVQFTGLAQTAEAESLGGSSRFAWLEIDEPFLVVERHDKGDPSGVRQVEFVLARPMMQYPVPALPEWATPEALPVPGDTGRGDGPEAPWLADGLKDILTNNKLPFPPCCDSPVEITRGTDLLPPSTPDQTVTVLGSGGTSVSSTDYSHAQPIATDLSVASGLLFVVTFSYAVTGPRGANPTISGLSLTQIGSITVGNERAEIWYGSGAGFAGDINIAVPGGNLADGTVDDVGFYSGYVINTPRYSRLVQTASDAAYGATSLSVAMTTPALHRMIAFMMYGWFGGVIGVPPALLAEPTPDDASASHAALDTGQSYNDGDVGWYNWSLDYQTDVGPLSSAGWTWAVSGDQAGMIAVELAP